MKEILNLLKSKMGEEINKTDPNTSMIVELAETYQRFSAFDVETIAEIGLGSRRMRIGQVPVREDGVLDEAMAAFKGFKNLAAPQEMDALLKARDIFEKDKDEEMVQCINNEIKQKVFGLLGNEKGEKDK